LGPLRHDLADPAPTQQTSSGAPMSADRPRSPRSPVPRLAMTATETAASLGVSADYFREYVAPDLRCVRRGRKRLYSVREVERWLDRHSAVALADDREVG